MNSLELVALEPYVNGELRPHTAGMRINSSSSLRHEAVEYSFCRSCNLPPHSLIFSICSLLLFYNLYPRYYSRH